jgi:proteic killer suppression protein
MIENEMEVRHSDTSLDRLEIDPDYTGGFSQAIVRSFRLRMQMIRAASDERDFYALKSLHFEKLKGDRAHQHSMRLNRQWRLILEIDESRAAKVVCIIGIEDYH